MDWEELGKESDLMFGWENDGSSEMVGRSEMMEDGSECSMSVEDLRLDDGMNDICEMVLILICRVG